MDLGRWESQMRKGNLELVILTLLMNEGEKYGLDILACLRDKFAIEIIEGTLYPLMNRLQEDGLVIVRWELKSPGHPRKFYSVTKKGREAAALMDSKLSEFIACYNKVKQGDGQPQKKRKAAGK